MEEGPVVEFEIRAHGQQQGQLVRFECSQDYLPLSMIELPSQPGAALLSGSWGAISIDEKEYEITLKVVLEILVGGTWRELEFGILPLEIEFSKSNGALTTEAAAKLSQSIEFKNLVLTGTELARHRECYICREDFIDFVTHLACRATCCRSCLGQWATQVQYLDVIVPDRKGSLTCPNCRIGIMGEISCCLEKSGLCGRIRSCVEDDERCGTVAHIDSEKWWHTKDEKEDADTKSKPKSGHEPDAEAHKLYKFRIIIYNEEKGFSLLHGELTRSTMPYDIKRDADVTNALKQHKFRDGIYEFYLRIFPDVPKNTRSGQSSGDLQHDSSTNHD